MVKKKIFHMTIEEANNKIKVTRNGEYLTFYICGRKQGTFPKEGFLIDVGDESDTTWAKEKREIEADPVSEKTYSELKSLMTGDLYYKLYIKGAYSERTAREQINKVKRLKAKEQKRQKALEADPVKEETILEYDRESTRVWGHPLLGRWAFKEYTDKEIKVRIEGLNKMKDNAGKLLFY